MENEKRTGTSRSTVIAVTALVVTLALLLWRLATPTMLSEDKAIDLLYAKVGDGMAEDVRNAVENHDYKIQYTWGIYEKGGWAHIVFHIDSPRELDENGDVVFTGRMVHQMLDVTYTYFFGKWSIYEYDLEYEGVESGGPIPQLTISDINSAIMDLLGMEDAWMLLNPIDEYQYDINPSIYDPTSCEVVIHNVGESKTDIGITFRYNTLWNCWELEEVPDFPDE